MILLTDLLTAITAEDPVVIIGLNTNDTKLPAGATKAWIDVLAAQDIPAAVMNAFRIAKRPRSGAVFINLSQTIEIETIDLAAGNPPFPEYLGPAPKRVLDAAADLINRANLPVLLLGLEASLPENTKVLRNFLSIYPLPVVCTYGGAGVISRDLLNLFAGPVGLFKNQLGDQLLNRAELIMTVGFDPKEYAPAIWNAKADKTILHLDYRPTTIHLNYQPALEIIGGISENLAKLFERLKAYKFKAQRFDSPYCKNLQAAIDEYAKDTTIPIHPLAFIHALGEVTRDETIIMCDYDSSTWLAHYFLTVEPHHLLLNTEQQNLGKALPWAMAATLTRPKHKILSISSIEDFLSAADEFKTAAREKMHFVHIVWVSFVYDLEIVNPMKFAEDLGIRAYRINELAKLAPILKEALAQRGPVIVEVPIQYHVADEAISLIRQNAAKSQ